MLRNWLRRVSIVNLLKSKYFWLFVVVLLSHGFLLLMDGLFWDDYLLHDYFTSGKIDQIFSTFKEAGSFLNNTAYFHWSVFLVFGKNLMFGYRLIAIVLLFLIGVLLYKILMKLRMFSREDSFFVSAFAITYPAYKVAFLGINTPALFRLFLFLLAVFISISNVFGDAGRFPIKNILWRLFSLTLFLFSFSTNSFLVFYFGFLAMLFMTRPLAQGGGKRASVDFIFRRIDYILLPFMFLTVKVLFYHPFGEFIGYNNPIVYSPSGIYKIMTTFIIGFYYAFKPLFYLTNEPLFILALFILLIYVLLMGIRKDVLETKIDRAVITICYAIFLLCLAIFPYAAVGKYPTEYYESRHLLLVGVPMGLMIVAIMDYFLRHIMIGGKWKYYIYIVLIAAFSLINIQNYLDWQFRWIKDRSVILQLQKMPQAKSFSTFYVRNNAFRPEEASRYEYRPSEWSGIFKLAWNDEKWLGLDEAKIGTAVLINMSKSFDARHILSNYNPKGSKALLVLSYHEPAFSFSRIRRFKQVISKYYYYKYLNPAQLDPFLSKLVKIEIIKL